MKLLARAFSAIGLLGALSGGAAAQTSPENSKLPRGVATTLPSAPAATGAPALNRPSPAPSASEPLRSGKVQAEDLFRIALVEDARISADGKRVAFVVSRMDGPRNTYLRNIWIAPADASSPARQLTRGDEDTDPRWSPSGATLAFVSRRAKTSQIYALDLERGGEARPLTKAKSGATAPQWSHDGTRIAYSELERDTARDAAVDWHAAGIKPNERQRKTDIRTIDVRRFETNGAGYTYDRRSHLAVMNADGSGKIAVTSGRFSESGARWSPDDRTLAFGSSHTPQTREARSEIYTVPSAGGPEKKLDLPHLRSSLTSWSRDGNRLVYLTVDVQDPAGLPGLATARADGSDERRIVAPNEVTFGDRVLADMRENGAGCGPLPGPGDAWYVADVSVPGASALVRIDAASGASTTLIGGDREIAECSLNADGTKLAYIASDALHPGEVYSYDIASNTSVKISGLNDAYVAARTLSTPERFTAKNSKGQEVEYWVMRPPDAVAGKRYPTLVDIHGGPQTEFSGVTFFHEFQYWAARGWNVVFSNPRGSVGYGYAWTRELEGNWGDPMFDDVGSVTDAVAKRDDVDPARMAVLGGSYGGYATLWVIGHTTRFKAAVAERVVSNLFTQYLGADYAGSAPGQYSWGDPWSHQALYWRQSPLAYIDKVRTPLLILHSDNDTRTPVDQTYEAFNALKILRRPVTLIEVPRDNHDLSRIGEPIHRVERLHVIGDWLERRL